MRKKILIIEDETILAKLYKKKLEENGFEVKWISRLNVLEKTLLELKPQIVLLDNSLHGEDKSGLDFIPKIQKISPEAKIIMLSNYSDFHLKETALTKGAYDYFVKIDTPPSSIANYLQKLP